jgi:hypothetical protein
LTLEITPKNIHGYFTRTATLRNSAPTYSVVDKFDAAAERILVPSDGKVNILENKDADPAEP